MVTAFPQDACSSWPFTFSTRRTIWMISTLQFVSGYFQCFNVAFRRGHISVMIGNAKQNPRADHSHASNPSQICYIRYQICVGAILFLRTWSPSSPKRVNATRGTCLFIRKTLFIILSSAFFWPFPSSRMLCSLLHTSKVHPEVIQITPYFIVECNPSLFLKEFQVGTLYSTCSILIFFFPGTVIAMF